LDAALFDHGHWDDWDGLSGGLKAESVVFDYRSGLDDLRLNLDARSLDSLGNVNTDLFRIHG
jgi:hypothetical protein